MKTYTQIQTALLASVFMIGSCTIGLSQRGDNPTITKTFKMTEAGSLYVESSGGSVFIEGSNRNDVEVLAYVRYRGKTLTPNDPMLSELKENFEIIIEKNGSSIVVKADRSTFSSPWNQVGVAFTVFTPKEMSCDLTSNGGGLDVSGVEGSHQFESNGGGISMENIDGATEAHSSGGGVSVENQDGKARLVSSGGGISLTNGKGDIYARSSGGGVKLENVDGRIDASSSGGAVRIRGAAPSVVAQSSGGSISMDISGLTKEVELKTSGGGISAVIHNGRELGLDLDLKSQNVNIDLANFSGVAKKDRVEGKSNGGGIPVYMRTSGGSINVKFE